MQNNPLRRHHGRRRRLEAPIRQIRRSRRRGEVVYNVKMLKKTLVVLRVLVVTYFFGTIIYVSVTPPNGFDILGSFTWIFAVLIVFLAITVGIDRIGGGNGNSDRNKI